MTEHGLLAAMLARFGPAEGERGVFQPGEAIDLIGGELMVVVPPGAAIRTSAKALEAASGPGWEVRTPELVRHRPPFR